MNRRFMSIGAAAVVVLACVTVAWNQQGSDAPANRQKQLAALKELRDSGVLSESEYQAKLRTISAHETAAAQSERDPSSAGSATQRQTLKELRDNGLLSEDEYRAKMQALNGVTRTASNAFANPATRTVEIFDQQLGMRSATLQVPADWKFAGVIDRSRGCHGTGPEAKTYAHSPDGLTAIEVYPGLAWTYGYGNRRTGLDANGCEPAVMSTSTEFLKRIVLPNLRPEATLDGIVPLYPEEEAALQERLQRMRDSANREYQQFSGLYSRPADHILDGMFARVHYSIDGHEVEETIAVRVHCVARYYRNGFNPRHCNAQPTLVLRAPRGTLDALRPRMLAINRTYRMDENWDSRMAQISKQQSDAMIAASNAQFQSMMEASKADERVRTQIWQQGEQNRADSVARSSAANSAEQNRMNEEARAWTRYAGDQRAFIDRRTGTEYDLSNKYSDSYLSPDGSHYYQTNDKAAGSPWIGGTHLEPR